MHSEMNLSCSKHGRNEKCLQTLIGNPERKRRLRNLPFSWCRGPSGSHDRILISVWHWLFCLCRAPPDERTGLSSVLLTWTASKSICISFYIGTVKKNLHFHCWSSVERLSLLPGVSYLCVVSLLIAQHYQNEICPQLLVFILHTKFCQYPPNGLWDEICVWIGKSSHYIPFVNRVQRTHTITQQ
jgi:hypothetical protein